MRAIGTILIVVCSFLLVLHYQFNLLKQLTQVNEALIYVLWSGIPIGMGMFLFWSIRPKDVIQDEKPSGLAKEDSLVVMDGAGDKKGTPKPAPSFDPDQSFVSFDDK